VSARRPPEAAIEVLLYGLGLPAKKRPTFQDAVTARQILLGGLARDNGIGELITELARLHPRHDTFPGEVFLRLAADALDWCGASQEDPVPLEGTRERFLAECSSAAGKTTSSSSLCWQQRHSAAAQSPTCSARPHGGRPTTSGNTRSVRARPC
jgi:hypothetical protein